MRGRPQPRPSERSPSMTSSCLCLSSWLLTTFSQLIPLEHLSPRQGQEPHPPLLPDLISEMDSTSLGHPWGGKGGLSRDKGFNHCHLEAMWCAVTRACDTLMGEIVVAGCVSAPFLRPSVWPMDVSCHVLSPSPSCSALRLHVALSADVVTSFVRYRGVSPWFTLLCCSFTSRP